MKKPKADPRDETIANLRSHVIRLEKQATDLTAERDAEKRRADGAEAWSKEHKRQLDAATETIGRLKDELMDATRRIATLEGWIERAVTEEEIASGMRQGSAPPPPDPIRHQIHRYSTTGPAHQGYDGSSYMHSQPTRKPWWRL